MPKIKTNRAAAKRFKKNGDRQDRPRKGFQEPHPDEKVPEEKTRATQEHRCQCNQCKVPRTDVAVFFSRRL